VTERTRPNANTDALSYALVLHAVNFFPYVAAGAVALQAHAVSLRTRAG
jgi:hypothetical protein